jgi:hypothetical protein
MDHPNAPQRKGDTANKLSRDFRDRKRSQNLNLSSRSRARKLRTALLGGFLGGVAVAILCMVENQILQWYSPAWEVLLLGLAGYLLVRSRGGFLNGLVLFGLAYTATILLREFGYDSSVVLGEFQKAREVSLHGDFAALCGLAVLGGLIGFSSDHR